MEHAGQIGNSRSRLNQTKTSNATRSPQSKQQKRQRARLDDPFCHRAVLVLMSSALLFGIA
jgi:hypothetical protein